MQDAPPTPLSAGGPLARRPRLAHPFPSPDDSTDRGFTLEAALRQQRPVICAVDNDDLAADVLATAAGLAAQLAVPLTVIHSPDPDVFRVGEPRRAALARGNAFVEELADGYTVDERVVELDDPARLVTAVAQEGATLVVIGTRRRTGLRAALLGSVSQAVIGSAVCPVMTVPEAAARTNDARSGGSGRSPTTSDLRDTRPHPVVGRAHAPGSNRRGVI